MEFVGGCHQRNLQTRGSTFQSCLWCQLRPSSVDPWASILNQTCMCSADKKDSPVQLIVIFSPNECFNVYFFFTFLKRFWFFVNFLWLILPSPTTVFPFSGPNPIQLPSIDVAPREGNRSPSTLGRPPWLPSHQRMWCMPYWHGCISTPKLQ